MTTRRIPLVPLLVMMLLPAPALACGPGYFPLEIILVAGAVVILVAGSAPIVAVVAGLRLWQYLRR